MFIEEIDISAPDIIIDLAVLANPSDIYSKMYGVTHYAYAFYWRSNPVTVELIQIGESAPDEKRININTYGERIVRKAANLPGWPTQVISDNGIDLFRALQQAEKKEILPYVPTRSEILIGVWDLSIKTTSVIASKRDQSRWVEAELFNQFKSKNLDRIPICNVVDSAKNKARKKAYVDSGKIDTLFSFRG